MLTPHTRSFQPKITRSASYIVTGLFGLTGIFLLCFLSLFSPTGDKIALVFPPNTDRDIMLTRIAQAGGRVIGYGSTDNLAIVNYPQSQTSHIKNQTGAWLAFNAQGVSACFQGD